MEEKNGLEEINIYELLRFYKKHWIKIMAAVLFGLSLAAFYTFLLQKPLYKSEATLIAVGLAEKGTGQGSTQLNNYTQLFNSRRVLEPVLQNQPGGLSYATLVQQVKATNDKDTELIKLSVTSESARTSQKLTNGIIASFRNEVKDIYGTDNIRLVDGASLPTHPANVRRVTQLGLGAIGGLLLGVLGLFFVFDFAHSQTAGLSAGERLLYEKTRQAERAKALAVKLEHKAARQRARRERRNTRAEQRTALTKRWADARAARALARAEKRSQLLEARVKKAELRAEARKAKAAARQAVKEARIAARTERQAEQARLKAKKMKYEAAEKAKRLRAEESRQKSEERRRKAESAARAAEAAAQVEAQKAVEKAEAERKKAEAAKEKAEAEATAARKKIAAAEAAERKRKEADAQAKVAAEAMALKAAADVEAHAQKRIMRLEQSQSQKLKKRNKRKKNRPVISLHAISTSLVKETKIK